MAERDKTQSLVRFEGFELDLRAGELRPAEGSPVRLSEQPFRILTALVERPGEVVLREEIRQALWPNDTVVEFEHSINAAMKRLRQALGESAENPRYIETLARRGYRWMVPVQWVEPAPARPGSPRSPEEPRPERESSTASMVGKKVSHYRVLEILGGGGMGVVYKAEDLKLGRRVAVKFLPEELASEPSALERFEREARAASALDHPNICSIYEFGEHESQPFIVMQLLEGQTLRERIGAGTQQGAALRTVELLDLAIQITEGLDAAHQKGIIHRDIKPANIFVTTKGQAKILDFGVAKLTLPETAEEVHPASDGRHAGAPTKPQDAVPATDYNPFLSRTGAAIGTAGYMSPEQARGEKLDARTDLFSFGLALYEMATGQRAFPGDTAPVLREAILNRTPVAAGELNPELPSGLEGIIHRALEKNREIRYQSAGDIRTDLQRLKQDADVGRSAARMEEPAARGLTTADAPASEGATFVRRHWAGMLGVAAVALGAAAAVYFYIHRGPTLTDKDTIVLTDFTNTTGDAVFDDTLKQALSIQLEQSPFLSLVSEARVQQTLRMMGQPADARLTPKIARELCQRAESTAVLEGAIASLGSEYVLGLKAVNCATGDTLAQEQGTASRKEQVLKVLDGAAVKLRSKLGESINTVEKYATPIEQATTPSLEALQAYSLGRKAMVGNGDYAAAMPLFQRAIHLDPNFAVAYAALGAAYANLSAPSLAAEYTRKSYDLRERVSERERFYIESHYYHLVTGDLEKARQVYELWARIYPRDFSPIGNLGRIYESLGQRDKCAEITLQAIRLNPGAAQTYANRVDSLLQLDRLEDARATAEEARAKNLDSPALHTELYTIAFLQSDAAGMAQQVAWGTGKPGVEDFLLSLEAETSAFFGKLKNARELSSRAIAIAKHEEESETASGFETEAALRESLFGNAAEARKRAAAALALSTDRDVQFGVALALAFAGDSARAQTLANDLAKRFPEDTMVNFNYLPTLRAQLALSHKVMASASNTGAGEAIAALQAAAPYELGIPGIGDLTPTMYPVYVRGEAYLAAHQGREAAAEFQKMLDRRGTLQNAPTGALAHLGLARAYTLSGDTVKARAKYQEFLTLWKDADPDIPILQQAKAERAKLQ